MFVDRISDLMRQRGWKRRGIAVLCGLCLTLALPPLNLLPFIVPALSGLLLLLRGSERDGQVFADGWWFGVGFFVSGIYWISISLLVEPERYAWLIPFAVFGLSGLLALYYGIAAWLTWRLRWNGAGQVIGFAVIWTMMEWLRGHAFTGFPWNLAGYVWSFSDAAMQSLSLFGIYGLSLLTVLLAAMPSTAIVHATERRGGEYRALWITLVLALCLIGWGQWRISTTPVGLNSGVVLRLVQGNIPQQLKWQEGQKFANLRHYMELTTSEGFDEITHVIWPESSLPYALEPDSELAVELGRRVVPPGGALITGAVRMDENRRIYNGVQVIGSDGHILAHYDKHRLVPFGEFIPLRSLLPLTKITHGSLDFSRGQGPKTLDVAGVPPFSPLVCYEAVFPELAVDGNSAVRPAWLLNVTNDAWFGQSLGPYQHFHMARSRAIEQGLPMVRLAGSGITAVIDPLGRILDKLRLNETAVLDSSIPKALPEPTLYAAYGEMVLLVLLVTLLILGILLRRQ